MDDKEVNIVRRSHYFSPGWYRRKYPDVKRAGIDPAVHYVRWGWKEGCNPSSAFSTSDYLSLYPDVKESGMCPLVHYERYGKKEKRRVRRGRSAQGRVFSFSLLSFLSDCRSWLYSAYFNFHYLPFRQAVKMPIIFHKPRFIKLGGSVRIEGEVRRGMIKLGHFLNSLYPDNGIAFENHGGEIVFNGITDIGGGNTAISIGAKGRLDIGKNFFATTGLKLVCYHRIRIHDSVRCGWEVMMMDTGFHRLKDMDGNFISDGYAPIELGHHTWVSTRCMVMPGSGTAPYTIVAAGSMLNKKFTESYVMLAGSPAKIKKTGIWRDFGDDRIEYPD